MVFDHSDGDDLAYLDELAPPVDCSECDGEGEVEHGIRRDYFGVWETQTFRCSACDGTGRADHDQEHHVH